MERQRTQGWDRARAFGLPILLAGIGLASALSPQTGFSESENRFLQKRPEFTWDALLSGEFGTKYESYLSDQFPGRESFVAAKTQAERICGSRDSGGVYFGEDGYLIEKFDTEDIEGPQLEKNLDALAQAAARMAERYGADHVRVMLAPGASQILTDKLPDLASPYDQSRVVEALAERLGGGRMIVPAEEALKARYAQSLLTALSVQGGLTDGGARGSAANASVQDSPADAGAQTSDPSALYYRTDHHWTTSGAYTAYRAWAESAGIEPWSEERFTRAEVSSDFLGTLYSKVQTAVRPDSIVLYRPNDPMEYRVEYDMDGVIFDDLYAWKALETRDQYAVFLDGNHGLVRIENRSREGDEERQGRKLMVIKDSYANSMTPFLVNHFEETYLIDLRYFNAKAEDFAREQGITDVLFLYRIPGFAQEKTVTKLR